MGKHSAPQRDGSAPGRDALLRVTGHLQAQETYEAEDVAQNLNDVLRAVARGDGATLIAVRKFVEEFEL